MNLINKSPIITKILKFLAIIALSVLVSLPSLILIAKTTHIFDGKPGPSGPSGHDGHDGHDGNDGKDGKDGNDGKDGKDGKPGLPQLPKEDENIMIHIISMIIHYDKDKKEDYLTNFTGTALGYDTEYFIYFDLTTSVYKNNTIKILQKMKKIYSDFGGIWEEESTEDPNSNVVYDGEGGCIEYQIELKYITKNTTKRYGKVTNTIIDAEPISIKGIGRSTCYPS